MRIAFMGTPDFAAASLAKLIEENYEIAGVFTQPDKPRGRGMAVSASPVKELALAHGISIAMSSDHGNIESISAKGHTRNPVPLVACGECAAPLLDHVKSLVDVTPALLPLLANPK